MPMTFAPSGTSLSTALFAATCTPLPIFRCPANPDWPATTTLVAKLRRSGDPDLRDEQAVPADSHVVRDHHEIVDLRPFADDGLAECGAIDRRAGADLDVVLDAHDSDLRNLVMASAFASRSHSRPLPMTTPLWMMQRLPMMVRS